MLIGRSMSYALIVPNIFCCPQSPPWHFPSLMAHPD